MRKNKAPIKECLIVMVITIPNITLGIILLLTGLNNAINKNLSIVEIILNYLGILVYILLFIIILIIGMIEIIKNRKEKEITLICKGKRKKVYVLLDEKGQMYSCTKKNLESNKNYKVIIYNKKIVKILEETDKKVNFNGIKENYWLTLYSPIIGDSKDTAYLPIIYTVFFLFISVPPAAICIFFTIIYDGYVKYRIKQKAKELLERNPNYTYENYENIEKEIKIQDAPYIEKIMNFWNKYKILFIIILILIVIILFHINGIKSN